MSLNVLITGGAGFIGRHLSQQLAADGGLVTVLDNFSRQIHGSKPPPTHLSYVNRLIVGDIRDRIVVEDAIKGQDVIVHLAAETGTGQSMYEILQYEGVNINGTAVLLDCLLNDCHRTAKRLVVASSRAIYGEGAYSCAVHGTVYPGARLVKDMELGAFEPRCPVCNHFCQSIPTSEVAPLAPTSFYGLTKQVQEQMVLMFAKTLGIAAFALRYQNVYGPGQSLQNPYTGILAIFSNLAREGKPINVFEDGQESRDFVYIDDVVQATTACIYSDLVGSHRFNVGSGLSTTVLQVAKATVAHFASSSELTVTGAFRIGDIRHNTASLFKVASELNYQPKWSFQEGLTAFLHWAKQEGASSEGYERSLVEMRSKGLLLGEGTR